MSDPLESLKFGRLLSLSSTTIPDLTKNIVQPHDWRYCEAGGFGDVFRCQYKGDGGIREVAVKAFRFNFSVDEHKLDEGKVARMIHRELGIWRRLNHPNIVPFLGIVYGFGKQGSASLVSMWMPHGTLHTFLEGHDNRLGVAHRLQLLLDIANGLQYLHSFPVVHGDLTSNNVLLDHNYNACLTDFGCASLVGELPNGFAYLKMSTVRPGTLRWAAPEYFSLNEEETKHTIKSDIYSFGNMALLVLSGKYPWSEVRADTAVMMRLSQGLNPARPLARPIDDLYWSFIERCWSSISERPPAEEVVSSLQKLLGACTSLPPLHELLGTSTPPCSAPNFPDSHARNRAEAVSYENSKVGSLSGGISSLQHANRSENIDSAPGGHATNASPEGRPLISKWVRGELVGKGTYGSVYLALNAESGEIFAVKQVEKGHVQRQPLVKFISKLKMEREILSGLHHPHIMAYLGFEETEDFLSVFLEYAPGGTITTCLRAHGMFGEEVIKSFTAQIFDGLAYLHANCIIHRNIEATNILVYPTGICKLSGFGNAQRTGDDHASWVPMRGIVFGTAPEVVRNQASQGGKRYGPKVDVWSAGCVLLKMWTGGKGWRDGTVFALMVKSGSESWQQGTTGRTFPPISWDVVLSDLAIDFSNRCFVTDPERRASAAELRQHPYLTPDPNWVFTSFK